MYDHNQLVVPDSFVALYLAPGRLKATETREFITRRYEFCEDLAASLYDYARSQHYDVGVSEDEILARCRAGLRSEASGISDSEATWVVRRLAELEGWNLSAAESGP